MDKKKEIVVVIKEIMFVDNIRQAEAIITRKPVV